MLLEDSRAEDMCNACVLTWAGKDMGMGAKQEELISREALLVEIKAAARFAELKGAVTSTVVLNRMIKLIEEQPVRGVVNPTQTILYTGERE